MEKMAVKVVSRPVEVKVFREAKLTLSIVVSRTKALVGESLTVNGRLRIDTLPLCGQQISIFQDKEKVATATTDENGNYSAKIVVPTVAGKYEYHAEANIDEETITKMGYIIKKEEKEEKTKRSIIMKEVGV